VKFKVLSGLVALGALMVGMGCGDSSSNGGGGNGGTAEGGNPTTGGNGVGGMIVITGGNDTGGGGATGDGNDSFDQAIEIVIDDPAQAYALDPAPTDIDYFFINGTEGQAIQVLTDAKSGLLGIGPGDGFVDGYADLVIELYDANQNLIATNDDPIPRNTQDSMLLTVLPTTGKYYIKVSEFCLSWDQGPMGQGCYADLDVPDYGIAVAALDPAANSTIQQIEPNDAADNTATPWEFEPNTPGVYYASIGYGDFGTASDTDFYAFTPPNDVSLDVNSLFTGRLDADFYFYPSGTDGSGSVADVGVVRLIDATDGSVVAELDASAAMDPTFGAQLSVPVIGGHDYYFQADGLAGSQFGAGYFYFTWGSIGPNNPIEDDPAFAAGGPGNETIADADTLYEQTNMDPDSSTSWFIEGNIDSAADVDFYQIPLAGGPLASVTCVGINVGSGLTVKASLVDGAGAVVGGGVAVETLNQTQFLANIDVPTSGMIYLKVEQGAQNPNVTGTSYRCGVTNYTTPI